MASHDNKRRTGASADARSESGVDEEGDYESDSEGISALALRRREASDDEEEERELRRGRRTFDRGFSGDDDRARAPFSDEDAEDEGAPPVDEEEEEEYEDAVETAAGRRNGSEEEEDDERRGEAEGSKHHREDSEDAAGKAQNGATAQGTGGAGSKDGVAEDKKDAEPFVVPTAGAFYMHDDRFRDNGGARPRRSAGGRKLWEAKDEKPWVHDRFEELNLHEESYHGQGPRGRGGRGRLRGRGRGRDSGYTKGRGGRERVFEDTLITPFRRGSGRGRGLRRSKMDDYEQRESPSTANKSAAQASRETATSSSPTPQPALKQPALKQSESKKPVSGSVLNSASPPFYPSGALQQNLTGPMAGTRKVSRGADEQLKERDAQQGGRMGLAAKSATGKGITGLSPAVMTRQPPSSGNSASSTFVASTVEVDGGLHKSLMKGPNTLHQQMLKTGSGSMLQHQQPSKSERKAQPIIEQPLGLPAVQQTGRGMQAAQSAGFLRVQQPQTSKQGQISQQQPAQTQTQTQTSGTNMPSSSKPAVDLKAAPLSPGNKVTSSGSGRGGQGTALQAGRGSFVYAGAPSGGLTNGLRSGEPSFSSSSAMLPIVQFAGQPQAGLGVPAVGVALPGYSSQPQFGFANSEVTWVPILAGGGALGSNYSSPYITVDGASSAVYYTQPTSQPAGFAIPGRELNGAKPPSSSWKPPTRPDFGSDEFAQRQSKPRRYSEMNFGQ